MAQATTIEWTEHSWNFLRGCSRVSEGCRNCYAERQAIRHAGPGGSYEGLVRSTPSGPKWTGKVTFHEDILLAPLKRKKPTKYFVNSMSDLFHENVKDEWLDKAFAVMALTPQHTYQILTKRPERMREYLEARSKSETVDHLSIKNYRTVRGHDSISRWMNDLPVPHRTYVYDRGSGNRHVDQWPLPNVWLGGSVEDQKTANERIPQLLQTPAAVRWVSYEPALGAVDFNPWLPDSWSGGAREDAPYGDTLPLDWIVVGGESGHGARPCDLAWIRSVVEQCKAAGVPVFVKQLGAAPISNLQTDFVGLLPVNLNQPLQCKWQMPLKDRKGGNMSEWPEDLRIREFPK